MTMTVAAELLWSTAVTASPVRTPSSGVAVSRASSRFMASPAARCKARLILSIPYRNIASPPNSAKSISIPCSIRTPPCPSVYEGAVPEMQKEDIPKS